MKILGKADISTRIDGAIANTVSTTMISTDVDGLFKPLTFMFMLDDAASNMLNTENHHEKRTEFST